MRVHHIQYQIEKKIIILYKYMNNIYIIQSDYWIIVRKEYITKMKPHGNMYVGKGFVPPSLDSKAFVFQQWIPL